MYSRDPMLEALFCAVNIAEPMSKKEIEKTIAMIKAIPLLNLNHFKDTLLTSAAGNGHTAIIKELVDAKTNIEAKSYKDRTSLMKAARNGHVDAVAFLIAAKADLNARDEDGNTALMLANEANTARHRLVASQLVRAGAKTEAKSSKDDVLTPRDSDDDMGMQFDKPSWR